MTWADEIAGYREDVQASFGVFRRSPRKALLWITTVIDVLVVTLDDDVAAVVRDAVASYRAERRAVYRRSGRISRNPRGQTRWSGCIEIDLICSKIARLCSPMKTSLLAEFGVDVAALRSDQQVLVLHEHALVDHRGHESAEALKRDLRAAWPGPRRVHAAELHQTGTVTENVERLADYSTKFRFRHSIAWNGQKTQYMGDYAPEWREYVKNVYAKIGIQKLLDSNVSSQSDNAVAARRMYADQAISVDENAEIVPVQLGFSKTSTEAEGCNSYNPHNDTSTSQDDEGETMRVHEIIGKYIDFEKMTPDTYNEIVDDLERSGLETRTPEFMARMYGDPAEELELEQRRLDIEKTEAEIERLRAAADRDRAEARRPR